MAPYRPPHMRNQPPLPKLVCSNRDEVIRTQPSQSDTIATLTANLAEEFHVPEELISLAKDGAPLQDTKKELNTLGECTIHVTVKPASHEQMENYIRSKGSDHFLGAELKLTTNAGEELKGELYCIQEQDNSCILREKLPNGCANFWWLKWNIITSISIESMPDKKRSDFRPAAGVPALERRS
ncbi:unnamed protein product [Symbiodinium necroappetens]|uniref:Ubiquitin-like domain-containing protein n=1 Tax=Symbiodinium necroappetens TaxID=1628268 RepID=A0A812ZUY1_9DINO|nr:unnamed protein product [Symbiodinium necroappetens]CAE7939925.1 unnamed protein product [Symbiodinium sp. KB8]